MYQIWEILESQGRSMVWLAKQTGYSADHVYHLRLGTRKASLEFQVRAERVLQIPRSVLFASVKENAA